MIHCALLLLAAGTDAPAALQPLTTTGWTVMLASVSAVLALSCFCVYRVLRLPPVEEDTLKGPLKIDTRDTTDAD